MNNLSLFPKLNDSHIKKINYNQHEDVKFSFKKTNESDFYDIKISNTASANIYFNDEYSRWVYPFHNLRYNKTIKFNPKHLFGKDGIAPARSKIGVAIKWESRGSMLSGIKHQFSFGKDEGFIEKEISIFFKEKTLRNGVDIFIVFYLYEKDSQGGSFGEEYLNNDEGVIIGLLEKKTLNFKGIGSEFPVETIDDKKQGLWFVNFTDFDYEKNLDECMKVVINQAHKNFHLLNFEEKKFNKELLEEIMISVVYQFILRAKEDYEMFINDDEYYENGTVGQLLNYYLKLFNIDLKNIASEELFMEINRRLR